MPSTKRWGGLRPAPYNPNARDADHDGLVQEGTVWERPGGTRFVNAAGKEIAAAMARATPGAYIADADGNRVDYTPVGAGGGAGPDAPGVQMPRLGDMGHPSIGETNGTIQDMMGTLEGPPEVPEPDRRDVFDPEAPPSPRVDLDVGPLIEALTVDAPPKGSPVGAPKDRIEEARVMQADRLKVMQDEGLPIMRGMFLNLDPETRSDIQRLLGIPEEDEDYNMHLRVGPRILDELKETGIGTHWTANPEMAKTAAGVDQTGKGNLEVVFIAKSPRAAALSDDPDVTGVLNRGERELTFNNDTAFDMHSILVRDGNSWIEVLNPDMPYEPKLHEDYGDYSKLDALEFQPGEVVPEAVTDVIPDTGFSADALARNLEAAYPGLGLDMYKSAGKDSEGNPVAVLSRIVIPEDERGEGTGTEVMEEIVSWADTNGYTVALSPSADFGGDKDRLDKFYRRLGFSHNSGVDKDYAITDTMYRLPEKEAPKATPVSKLEIVDATNRRISDKITGGGHVETAARDLRGSGVSMSDLDAEFPEGDMPSLQKSTRRYAGDGWQPINGSLRGGVDDLSDEDAAVVQVLEKAIDLSKTDRPYTVFRGTRASSIVGKDVDDTDVGEALGNLVGETISDPAFLSTSLSHFDAIRFSSKRKEGEGPSTSPSVVMRIDVPEGTGAYSVQSRYNEKEVLLQRDASLKVTGVTEIQNAVGRDGESVYVVDVGVVRDATDTAVPSIAPVVNRELQTIDDSKPLHQAMGADMDAARPGLVTTAETALYEAGRISYYDDTLRKVVEAEDIITEYADESWGMEANARFRDEPITDADFEKRGWPKDLAWFDEHDVPRAEYLDSVIDLANAESAYTTYRGLPIEGLVPGTHTTEGYEKQLLDLVGETIADKGFFSTSIDPEVAVGFTGSGGGGIFASKKPHVVMSIDVPEGGPGLYLGGVSGHTEEDEVLFRRNAGMVVTGISRRDFPDRKVRGETYEVPPTYIVHVTPAVNGR